MPTAHDHQVTARGLSFHYVEWGTPSAPPLLCLHGIEASRSPRRATNRSQRRAPRAAVARAVGQAFWTAGDSVGRELEG